MPIERRGSINTGTNADGRTGRAECVPNGMIKTPEIWLRRRSTAQAVLTYRSPEDRLVGDFWPVIYPAAMDITDDPRPE
jgi:hypothetical protein